MSKDMTADVLEATATPKQKPAKTPKALNPLSPTETKTSALCLAAVRELLVAGKGRFTLSGLSAKVGGTRRARHAIWIARYAGLKLDVVRNGRKAAEYVNSITTNVPQTKAIPAKFREAWKITKVEKGEKVSNSKAAIVEVLAKGSFGAKVKSGKTPETAAAVATLFSA